MFGPVIDELISSLRGLPGVGPKSAQRMALHLLERRRDAARRLAISLEVAAEKIGRCRLCRTLTETDLCIICSDHTSFSSLYWLYTTKGKYTYIRNRPEHLLT